MSATLFNHVALEAVQAGIEANRAEAGDLVRVSLAGDSDASARMVLLNESWAALEQVRHELAGIDFAPYRMVR